MGLAADTRLTALAAWSLSEVVTRIQGLPVMTRTIGKGADAAEIWPAPAEVNCPNTIQHRLTIGLRVPKAAKLLLAFTHGPSRVIRSTRPTARARRTGDLVRTVPLDLPFMLIKQGVAVLLEAGVSGTQMGFLVVRDEQAVNCLVACHDLLWSAVQMDTPVTAGNPLPRHLKDLVAELATGATDAAAARRLHVSERTVSRRMAEVLDLLGATSRFQAGIVVAHSGLIAEQGPYRRP